MIAPSTQSHTCLLFSRINQLHTRLAHHILPLSLATRTHANHSTPVRLQNRHISPHSSKIPLATSPADSPSYRDYLGPQWEARTWRLSNTDGLTPKGRSDVAVLVGYRDAATLIARSHTAALYLPGFHDSFFHRKQGEAWRTHDIPLFGLEFRRSGRALRSEASRDALTDLRVREEEINDSIAYLRELGAQKIILIGHSTGGLQAAWWAGEHPSAVDAVILNSPWLDHNGPELEKGLLTRIIITLGGLFPRLQFASLGGDYARSLHTTTGGEFTFNTHHKTLGNIPVRLGFFRSVRLMQAAIARGDIKIDVPLLIAHSSAAGDSRHPTPQDLASKDCVLNPEDMLRLGPVLSRDVTFLEVPGGRHDLALSRAEARDAYTKGTIAWALDTLGFSSVSPER